MIEDIIMGKDDKRLSTHFLRSEFDCRDGTPADPDPKLILCLERLRAIRDGRPLRIISGFRTPSHNHSIGGARRSQHLLNRAADIPRFYATISQARQAGFTGIGHCEGWVVHLDVRRSKRRIFLDC